MPRKYPKLRGRIIEKYGTFGAFAKVLDVHVQQVSRKLNGKLTYDDVVKWAPLLDVKLEEYGAIFFTEKVQ